MSTKLIASLMTVLLTIFAGCAQAPITAERQDDRIGRAERIGVPLMTVEYPRRLDNARIAYAMAELSKARTLCTERVVELTCESRASRKTGRNMLLATALAGVLTAAATGSAQFYESDSNRADFEAGVGIGGGILTGILGAIAVYYNADDRAEAAQKKIGVIEQLSKSFLEEWNRILGAYGCEDEEKTDLCPDGEPGSAESQHGWVEVRQDEMGLYWSRRDFPQFLADQRALLSEERQGEMSRELISAISRLMSTCGTDQTEVRTSCEMSFPGSSVSTSRDPDPNEEASVETELPSK